MLSEDVLFRFETLAVMVTNSAEPVTYANMSADLMAGTYDFFWRGHTSHQWGVDVNLMVGNLAISGASGSFRMSVPAGCLTIAVKMSAPGERPATYGPFVLEIRRPR